MMKRKWKSTVSIITLVYVTILLLITAALVDMVYFSLNNLEREGEVNRAKWVIEGKTQAVFDDIAVGNIPLEEREWTITDTVDQKEQTIDAVLKQENNIYSLTLTMNWKDRYRYRHEISFLRVNLFDYALYFNNSKQLRLKKNMTVSGNIAVKGDFVMDAIQQQGMFYFDHTVERPYRIEYLDNAPQINPVVCKVNREALIDNPNATAGFTASDSDSGEMVVRNAALAKIDFPSFGKLWETFSPFSDSAWIIEDASLFSTEWIRNPLSSEKEMIAVGDNISTTYKVQATQVPNFYLKKIDSRDRFQRVSSIDYTYSYGPTAGESPFSFYRGQLTLKASAGPFPVLLPEEAYDRFGFIKLGGVGWSLISRDEKIEQLYENEVSPTTLMSGRADYEYLPSMKAIRFLSPKYHQAHHIYIGMGNGRKVSFPFYVSAEQMVVYVAGKRSFNFSLMGSSIVFTTPPAVGEAITMMVNPPRLYMKKAAPAGDMGIFIDKEEKVIRLHLPSIQNYPKNGVIFSKQPMLITGKTSQPLVILCTENVYLENINAGDDGEPIFVASDKGVWIYQRNYAAQNPINKCLIYTPLNDLMTVYDDGTINNPPITIYGSVFFSGERESDVMDMDLFEKNFIYFDGIKDYLTKPPFSYFPFPIKIQQVVRQ